MNPLLNLPAERLLGMRVRFLHPETKRYRFGRIHEISRTHMRIMSSKNRTLTWVRHEDVEDPNRVQFEHPLKP